MSSPAHSSTASPPAAPVPPPSSTLSPIDLRHMASSTALPSATTTTKTSTKKSSQHLRTERPGSGSRSPNSIPSSPTSVHSSSSAIFERDIEPLTPPSSSTKQNPHRIPRAKGTEQLEHAVPSVLDSAASILASLDSHTDEGVSVLAPISSAGFDFASFGIGRGDSVALGSGFTSPIGSLRSRSPSPGRRQEGLLEALEGVGGVSPHVVSSAGPGSPRSMKSSASLQQPTSARARTLSTQQEGDTFMTSPDSSPTQAPPTTTHTLTNRLSFISYADLLSSTPASLHPLSSLTTSASSDPPPHIPSVAGSMTYTNVIPGGSRGSVGNRGSIIGSGSLAGVGGSRAPSLRTGTGGVRDSMLLVDDVGGEWEREGLGRGWRRGWRVRWGLLVFRGHESTSGE
ncbi:hypothetical protein BDQ17DRAFT_1428508 [Cyathus striatus]|nr:hypothetical protein BDQ17DRAFT_1428508 [Cyathus striatus]